MFFTRVGTIQGVLLQANLACLLLGWSFITVALRTVVDSLCCIRGFSRIVSETYNVLFPHAL